MNNKILDYRQKLKLQAQVIEMARTHLHSSLHEDIFEMDKEQAEQLKFRYVDFPQMPVEDFSAMISMQVLEPSDIADIELPSDVNVRKFTVFLYDIDDKIFDNFGTIEVFRDPKNLPENSFYRSYWDGET